MSPCKSTACVALAAVITLIAGVSDAFVLPSASLLGSSRPNSRAPSSSSSSSSLSMGADGGTTRGKDLVIQTIATLLAGVTAAANFESANAANKLQVSSTASGSRVNKDPISLLQWGLPIDCKPARQLQEAVEAAKLDLFQKNWSRAVSNCSKAKSAMSNNKATILKAVGSSNEAGATKLIADIDMGLGALQRIVQDDGAGVVLEKAKLDEAYPVHAAIVSNVGNLEAMMVPADYTKKLEANIPGDFDSLPRLLGRASVEFVMEKPKGEKFDVGGVLYDKVRLTMVLDGFTAPVTAGTIVDLVQRGYYKNMPITRSDGFVVQTGDPDPEGNVHDFFPPGSDTARKIPLEIAVTEDKLPMYSVTTEDDGRGYAATRLPFQAYGALGMARSEFEADSASCQFFWLLFDSDLTPAGKNLLDGRYAEFGYTVDNQDLLADVKEGDIIKSVKVISGMENWKQSA
ncbi:unnamed protein product [Ectocarpus fasciculatus]